MPADPLEITPALPCAIFAACWIGGSAALELSVYLTDPNHKDDGVKKYVDTTALIVRITMHQSTSYSNSFKAQVVQECLQPGVSMASVVLRHGINANLVRKWISVYGDHQAPTLFAFVQMKLAPAAQPDQSLSPSSTIEHHRAPS